MSLTSILVYVDATPASDTRIELAFLLARRCDAYVTGAGLEEAIIGDGRGSRCAGQSGPGAGCRAPDRLRPSSGTM